MLVYLLLMKRRVKRRRKVKSDSLKILKRHSTESIRSLAWVGKEELRVLDDLNS